MLSLAFQLVQLVSASCECGYRTNTNEVWRYRVQSDFGASNASSSFPQDWQIVSRIQGQVTSSTPYQVNYTTSNVVLPWNGSANGVVTLIASAYFGAPGGAVGCGEIVTVRDDILYGSFRASYAVTGGEGAVAGFFSYADDLNENDIEILTKDGDNEVSFTNQGANLTDSSVITTLPNDAVTTDSQEYRFDWTADSVKYYVNDYFLTNITKNPSQEASQIRLNAWSNGDTFTGGPPTTDMQMSISSITMYFNSSNATINSQYQSACRAAGSHAICAVDSSSIMSLSSATSSASRLSAAAQSSGSVTSGASISVFKSCNQILVGCVLCGLASTMLV